MLLHSYHLLQLHLGDLQEGVQDLSQGLFIQWSFSFVVENIRTTCLKPCEAFPRKQRDFKSCPGRRVYWECGVRKSKMSSPLLSQILQIWSQLQQNYEEVKLFNLTSHKLMPRPSDCLCFPLKMLPISLLNFVKIG